jgi:hypothetical protein
MAGLGNYLLAQRIFAQCRRDYLRFDDRKTHLQARWLEGMLALGTGRLSLAEGLLEEVAEEYSDLGLARFAAMASLGLAEVYAEQGRTADLLRLSEGLVTTFKALDAKDEMVTALAFFRHAVEREKFAVEAVRRVSTYLGRAFVDADARFELPLELKHLRSLGQG